jgi:uncharacterized protein YjbI with pentapeptide repeats
MQDSKKQKSNFLSASEVESSPVGILIDFDNYSKLKFNAFDIRNSTLQGKMTRLHNPNKINITFSRLESLHCTGVNFTSVDFKDCYIKGSVFENCKFNDAALINNLFDDVTFRNCTFRMTSVTGCRFQDVLFENCDLRNVVINTCQFLYCSFKNCKTSNKIIEMSFLYDSHFYKTDIFMETILENFGLNRKHVDQSRIKVAKRFMVQPKDLKKNIKDKVKSDTLNTVERFKLDYFYDPKVLINGSDLLDETFRFDNWLQLCTIPKSFSLLLQNYSEFLQKNYDENNMPAWGLLKLHSMTGFLLEQKISDEEVYRSISGVHLSLSRFVEQFLTQLINTVTTLQGNTTILLVEGPMEQDFYYENLKTYFEGSSLAIENIIKHNSPNELILTWLNIKDIIPVIAVLLATRFKIEIENLNKNKPKRTTTTAAKLLPVKTDSSNKLQAFALELGFDEHESFIYQLKLKVITPGDLLFNLKLGLNTRILGKLKKILISLLDDSRKK